MADLTEEQKNARLNELVAKETDWWADTHRQVRLLTRTVPILILGDHSSDNTELNVMEKVIENLRTQFYSAIPLKEVSREGNHIHNERQALKRYPVILKLENKKSCGAGAIGENILIAGDKNIQEKTYLFVKETSELLERALSIDTYLLYFPRIYFCKDDADMIDKATKIAIRESFRLVYMSLNGQGKPSGEA
ncbi:MAG: hypothetical protein Q7R76_06790 [Candidatus Woesearchaeota archaeon]|nr:hypothetical protein [Candidatus Woesearchaeota archaeon]